MTLSKSTKSESIESILIGTTQCTTPCLLLPHGTPMCSCDLCALPQLQRATHWRGRSCSPAKGSPAAAAAASFHPSASPSMFQSKARPDLMPNSCRSARADSCRGGACRKAFAARRLAAVCPVAPLLQVCLCVVHEVCSL